MCDAYTTACFLPMLPQMWMCRIVSSVLMICLDFFHTIITHSLYGFVPKLFSLYSYIFPYLLFYIVVAGLCFRSYPVVFLINTFNYFNFYWLRHLVSRWYQTLFQKRLSLWILLMTCILPFLFSILSRLLSWVEQAIGKYEHK